MDIFKLIRSLPGIKQVTDAERRLLFTPRSYETYSPPSRPALTIDNIRGKTPTPPRFFTNRPNGLRYEILPGSTYWSPRTQGFRMLPGRFSPTVSHNLSNPQAFSRYYPSQDPLPLYLNQDTRRIRQ